MWEFLEYLEICVAVLVSFSQILMLLMCLGQLLKESLMCWGEVFEGVLVVAFLGRPLSLFTAVVLAAVVLGVA